MNVSVNVDVKTVGSHLAGSAWVAQKTFFATVAWALLAGLVLAGCSWWALSAQHGSIGAIGIALALGEALFAGIFLGGKRGIAAAAAESVTKMQLGRVFVGSLFDRMMALVETETVGERGHVVTKGTERMPLAQANALLHRAVTKLTGDAAKAGWLRRKIQSRLTQTIEKYTLARFRDENALHGGVDLVKVRTELERMADGAIASRMHAGAKAATALVALMLPLVVWVQTWALQRV